MKSKNNRRFFSRTVEGRKNQLANLRQNWPKEKRIVKIPEHKLDTPEYREDIIRFLEEQFYIPETREQIILEPFQKEKIFRPLFYGDRPYTMGLIGEPKKSGKSCVGACIACWYLFTQGVRRGQEVEILLCASDKEQSTWTVYQKLKKAIKMNKQMSKRCKITEDRIETKNTGSVVRVLATDVSGGGSNADLVIFDELYLYRYPNMRDFFETMTTIPTKKFPLILILTTAGYEQSEDDLLYSLYLKGINLKRDPDPSFYFWWDSGEEANRMKWQTRKYLIQQKGRLREATFRRFHYNEFTSSEEVFITENDIKECIDPSLRPALPDKKIKIVTGVDIGIKHDWTGICSVTKEAGRLKLINVKSFKGRKGKEVDLEEQVEAYIRKLADDFDLIEAFYDPYQFARSSQSLRKEGLKMTEYPQTLDRLTSMSQNLYDLIQGRNLILFRDRDLQEHLKNARAKETTRGWRLVKRGSKKIDLTISLAMACIGAIGIKEGATRLGRAISSRGASSYTEEEIEKPKNMPLFTSIGDKLGWLRRRREKSQFKILSKKTSRKKGAGHVFRTWD